MANFSLNSASQYIANKFFQWAGNDSLRNNLVRAQVNFQDFKLTATEMDDLATTPVALLPAPGAGLVNIVDAIFVWVNPGATPFELGSGVLEFRYTDDSGSKVITDIANGVVESATSVYAQNPGIVSVPVANAAIVAHASADVTAGDGDIRGRIFYHTVRAAELGAATSNS